MKPPLLMKDTRASSHPSLRQCILPTLRASSVAYVPGSAYDMVLAELLRGTDLSTPTPSLASGTGSRAMGPTPSTNPWASIRTVPRTTSGLAAAYSIAAAPPRLAPATQTGTDLPTTSQNPFRAATLASAENVPTPSSWV